MPIMTDKETTIAEIKAKVLAFADERDWQQFHSPKNLSMALAAESGELMEHFLWTRSGDEKKLLADPAKRQKIAEELADILIYGIEFANMTNIDLAAAIEAKMQRNAEKYPVEKAKGSSLKYNEL